MKKDNNFWDTMRLVIRDELEIHEKKRYNIGGKPLGTVILPSLGKKKKK